MISKITGEGNEITKKSKETKTRKERGITLIALVVTIIVLLILVGISIQILLGDNGILKKAEDATEKSKIGDYEEQLELLEAELAMDEEPKAKQDTFVDKFKEKLNENKNFDGSHVNPKSDDSLIVETKEGYIFEVSEEGTDYLGKRGDEGLEELPKDITQEDIEISIEPSNEIWTKEVKVTIEISNENYKKYELQYSIDEGTTWKKYKSPVTVKKNTKIQAKIVNALGDKADATTTAEITNIDTVPPKDIILVTERTTDSIQVTAKVTDGEETDYSGQSGIDKIYFKENGKWTEGIVEGGKEGSEATSTHIFNGLKQSQECKIQVKAEDQAGNVKETTDTITTIAIPDLTEENVTFKYSNADWNNEENVRVTITLAEELLTTGFKLQYKTPEETSKDTWMDYEDEGFNITKNGTIYARLIEKEGTQTGGILTHNYNFFDRKKPTIAIETEDLTSNSIKVNIVASDEAGDPKTEVASGLANEDIYTFYLEEVGGTGEVPVASKNEATHTYTSLVQGKDYNLKVTAKDKAGNIGEASVNITTKTVPNLSEEMKKGNLTFTSRPENWTNNEVKVTIESKDLPKEYTLEYKVDGISEWKEYKNEEITVSQNNTKIQARLIDDSTPTPQTGGYASYTVETIDKISPELQIAEISTSTTNSIKVDVTTSDTPSGLADENPIKYYLIEGEIIDLKQAETEKGEVKAQGDETTYTFTGLTQGTTYTVLVEVTDKAGNTKSANKIVQTTKIPDLTYGTNITYTYNPDKWTNTPPVDVTLNPQENINEGYTLQYKVGDDDSWYDYASGSFEVSQNCTIYTRLKETDGEQFGKEAEHELNLIDTEAPTVNLKVLSYSTNSLTVQATASETTPQSRLHDTERYEFSIYEGNSAEGVAIKTQKASIENTATFIQLTQNTEYTVKVVVKDNAGNRAEATITETVKKVPDLLEGDITFTCDTNGWTNKESVKITLSTAESVDLATYKLQYQTETDANWYDYTDEGFDITENGTIYARLIEREGTQTGEFASLKYGYFDRTAPTIGEIEITDITSNSFTAKYSATDDESGLNEEESYRRTYYLGANSTEGEQKYQSIWDSLTIEKPTSTIYEWITQGATLTLKIEARDKAGNIGTAEKSFTMEKIPDWNTSEFEFIYEPESGNWTNSSVKVTAKPDYLDNENYKLQMKTDSKTTWEDYTADGYQVSTNEKVYARLMEKNGSQTGDEKVGEVTWIDKENPTISELLLSDMNITDNAITVNIRAQDNGGSGIGQYEYYIDNEGQPRTTNKKSEEEDSYTYSGLEVGSSHTIKVIVKDKANNQAEVIKEVRTNVQMEKSELKIGEYVTYEPLGGSSTYESTLNNNGSNNQTIHREKLNWRILKIGNNENGLTNKVVRLISDPTSVSITYKGAEGYNNAVHDLNKMCETLYSHGTTKARSVRIEDFNDAPDGTEVSQTTNSYTMNTQNNTFPKIYEEESKGTLGVSEQDNLYSGTFTTNEFKESYWQGTAGSVLKDTAEYWIATRSRKKEIGDSLPGEFTIQSADSSLKFNKIFSTDNNSAQVSLKVRIVINLPVNVQIKRGTDPTTPEGAHSIIWENSTLDKSIVYVDSMAEKNENEYGDLKSSSLNEKYKGYVKYQGNNGKLEYDEEGAIVLDEDNPIPYYAVDEGYNLGTAYTISSTIKCDVYDQKGDGSFPSTVYAISYKEGSYICWLGIHNGYIQVLSYRDKNMNCKDYEYTEDGFLSTNIEEYNNQIMNIQVVSQLGGQTKLYINGVLKKTFKSGNLKDGTFTNVTLGDLRLGRGLKFKGKIYDFALYDSALSESEVQDNWNFFKR